METDQLADDGYLDCHCHAWRRWPYLPPVPDEDSRATVEQLIYVEELERAHAPYVGCNFVGLLLADPN